MALAYMVLVLLVLIIGAFLFIGLIGIVFILISFLIRKNDGTQMDEKREKLKKSGKTLLKIPTVAIFLLVFVVLGNIIINHIKGLGYNNLADKWKHQRVTDTMAQNDVIKMFIRAADNGDKDAVILMFSEDIRDNVGFEKQVEEFLLEYPGGFYGLEFDMQGGHSSEDNDYGKKIAYFSCNYEVKKEGQMFYVSFGGCHQNSYDETEVGLEYFCIRSEKAKVLADEIGRSIDTEKNPIIAEINVEEDFEIRRIDDEPWKFTSIDRKLTKDEVIDALRNSEYLDGVIWLLGEPNGWNRRFEKVVYELEPENGEARYVIISFDNHERITIGLSRIVGEDYVEWLN